MTSVNLPHRLFDMLIDYRLRHALQFVAGLAEDAVALEPRRVVPTGDSFQPRAVHGGGVCEHAVQRAHHASIDATGIMAPLFVAMSGCVFPRGKPRCRRSSALWLRHRNGVFLTLQHRFLYRIMQRRNHDSRTLGEEGAGDAEDDVHSALDRGRPYCRAFSQSAATGLGRVMVMPASPPAICPVQALRSATWAPRARARHSCCIGRGGAYFTIAAAVLCEAAVVPFSPRVTVRGRKGETSWASSWVARVDPS